MENCSSVNSSIKKFIIICGILIFSLPINCSDTTVGVQQYTSEANIKMRKEAIIRDCNFGKKMRLTVGGTASVLCAIFAYKMVKYLFAQPDFKKNRCLSNKQLTNRLIILEERFEKCKEPKLFSNSWFISIGKSALKGFVSSTLTGVGLKMFDAFYKRYSCFDSLTEFINVRFSELIVLDKIICNAQLYDQHLSNNSADLQVVKDRFVTSLRNLVANIEYIIAFMEYKIDSLEYVTLAQEDILIPHYLYKSLENYCSKVTGILEGSSQDKLYNISGIFKQDAELFIESFKGFENRIAWFS